MHLSEEHMMAYIKVDHAKLSEAAGQIDHYISQHKSSMARMSNIVSSLSTAWNGEDYNQVQKEWMEIHSTDSTSARMIKSIQGYSDSLRAAATKYKEAQARAINRANQLCR